MTSRVAVFLLALQLGGCATSPSCSAGILVLGLLPIPYVDCGVTAEPEDEQDDLYV